MSANGQLKRSELAPITKATNGEQCYLEKKAARSFMAMNDESQRKFNVTLRASSARTAYRPLKDQWYFWNQYKYHGGNLAAYPGTSNHGLGLAVDFATQEMRTIVDKIGAKYGWAKKWSDAPSEWWHIKYRHGEYPAVNAYKPLRVLKNGSKGVAVFTLQRRLRYLGYTKATPTGVFGPKTASTVRAFQRRHHLTPDGIAGAKTLKFVNDLTVAKKKRAVK